MTAFSRAASDLHTLEQCAQGDSPLHRAHPRTKIAVTLGDLAAVVSFPGQNVSALAPFAVYPLALLALSGVGAGLLFRRLLAALPFAAMVGLGNLFVLRTPMFALGPLAVSAGMLSLASILLKTALTVSAVLLLLASTPFAAISGELAALGLPDILCLQLALTYRYLSVLTEEARSMHSAYRLRSGRERVRMRDMGVFLGQLLLRSVDRAGRVYDAMKCRGFRGVFVSGSRRKFCPRDALCVLLAAVPLVCLRFFNFSVILGNLAKGIFR
jgi:cobalt/nickel transport system permease protein